MITKIIDIDINRQYFDVLLFEIFISYRKSVRCLLASLLEKESPKKQKDQNIGSEKGTVTLIHKTEEAR